MQDENTVTDFLDVFIKKDSTYIHKMIISLLVCIIALISMIAIFKLTNNKDYLWILHIIFYAGLATAGWFSFEPDVRREKILNHIILNVGKKYGISIDQVDRRNMPKKFWQHLQEPYQYIFLTLEGNKIVCTMHFLPNSEPVITSGI